MNNKALDYYQYLAPLVLAPLSFWLWWRAYEGNLWLTLTAWLLPIVYAYIVPGVGTNILKVWEFNTRFRLGRFRPQHGFVFGGATALIAWCCHFDPARSVSDVARLSFVYASVLGFWNILYDIKAIRAGVLRVYNQPWADNRGPEAIALDYAPWFFAGFGAVYGAGVGLAEVWVANGAYNGVTFSWYFPLMLAIAMALPVWGYRRRAFKVHGHSGCRPVTRKTQT